MGGTIFRLGTLAKYERRWLLVVDKEEGGELGSNGDDRDDVICVSE